MCVQVEMRNARDGAAALKRRESRLRAPGSQTRVRAVWTRRALDSKIWWSVESAVRETLRLVERQASGDLRGNPCDRIKSSIVSKPGRRSGRSYLRRWSTTAHSPYNHNFMLVSKTTWSTVLPMPLYGT